MLKDHTFIRHIRGTLLGDKGYIASKEHREMLSLLGINLLTKQRKNMDPYLNNYYKSLLKERRQIESIFGFLKTRASLIFPFLRTAESFLIHVKAAVLTYMMKSFDTQNLSF